MAVHFRSEDPRSLLASFSARIEQHEPKGKITTWERSTDKIYYTHAARDWHAKAWFKPVIGTRVLTFNIIKPKNDTVKQTVYGYYHGHLIETFLNHFDQNFVSGEATAMPVPADNCA